jgi:polyisoprenoid-binding protein YceI
MNTKFKTTKIALIIAIVIAPTSLMSFSTESRSYEGPSFSLTNANSTINWKGTKRGGSHNGIIEVLNGTIDTDGSSIMGGAFTIDMKSIVCEDLTKEKYNKKLIGHLKSEDFFDVEKFPQAAFKITKVVKKMSAMDGFTANHMISGDLTLKGITKEISFPAKITMDANIVYAKTGNIILDRTNWNVNYQSKKVFANLMDNYINDDMIVSLNLQFDR